MLSLTRKADYGLVTMAELARRPTQTSARQVAESVGVPLPTVTNILHELMRGGLVTSTMGSKGGYTLAKPADGITLADMIDALEGPVKLTVCCPTEAHAEREGKSCDLSTSCRIRGPVIRVHEGIRRFLVETTLAELAFDQGTVSLNVEPGHPSRPVQPVDAA